MVLAGIEPKPTTAPRRTLCPVIHANTKDNPSVAFYTSANQCPDTKFRLMLGQKGKVTSLSFQLFCEQVTTPGALITTSARPL